MCHEAVSDCVAALKFIPDWSFTNKMLDGLLANDDTRFFDDDLCHFFSNGIGIQWCKDCKTL